MKQKHTLQILFSFLGHSPQISSLCLRTAISIIDRSLSPLVYGTLRLGKPCLEWHEAMTLLTRVRQLVKSHTSTTNVQSLVTNILVRIVSSIKQVKWCDCCVLFLRLRDKWLFFHTTIVPYPPKMCIIRYTSLKILHLVNRSIRYTIVIFIILQSLNFRCDVRYGHIGHRGQNYRPHVVKPKQAFDRTNVLTGIPDWSLTVLGLLLSYPRATV
jgi:hypothetical protein